MELAKLALAGLMHRLIRPHALFAFSTRPAIRRDIAPRKPRSVRRLARADRPHAAERIMTQARQWRAAVSAMPSLKFRQGSAQSASRSMLPISSIPSAIYPASMSTISISGPRSNNVRLPPAKIRRHQSASLRTSAAATIPRHAGAGVAGGQTAPVARIISRAAGKSGPARPSMHRPAQAAAIMTRDAGGESSSSDPSIVLAFTMQGLSERATRRNLVMDRALSQPVRASIPGFDSETRPPRNPGDMSPASAAMASSFFAAQWHDDLAGEFDLPPAGITGVDPRLSAWGALQ